MKSKKGLGAEVAAILNTKVPIAVHKEYIAYGDAIPHDILSKEEVAELVKELLIKKTLPERKKRILFRLAHTPILRALYGIQKYLKDPDAELAPWAVICWQEAQARVLNEGMRELFGSEAPETDIIMSGLGGNGKQLRYIFILSTFKSNPLTKSNIETVATVVKNPQKGSFVEGVEFFGDYLLFTSLVSFDVAVGDHIEHIINECNKKNAFLRFHYFVKNTEPFTREEINGYLAELAEKGL